MTPHPQSRASLLALQDNLRREELSRARVMALIPLKCEFLDLQFAHRLRAKINLVSTKKSDIRHIADCSYRQLY